MNNGIPITEMPSAIFEAAQRRMWDCTVGFVRVEKTRNVERAILLGSGVLVRAGERRAILTADHVRNILSTTGRIGLVLSQSEETTNIDAGALAPNKLGRGTNDTEGPDLAVLHVAPLLAGALSSKKTFYNLSNRQDLLLGNAPDPHAGIWAANGFVEELTIPEASSTPEKTVTAFCQFAAFGGVENYQEREGHDYYDFPFEEAGDIPRNFGGVSGSGLWQFVLRYNASEEIEISDALLRGLIFYQEPFVGKRSALRGHAHKSIYLNVLSAVANGAT